MARKENLKPLNAAIIVKLPNEAYQEIRRIAKEQWFTMSDIVRIAVREYLDKIKKQDMG